MFLLEKGKYLNVSSQGFHLSLGTRSFHVGEVSGVISKGISLWLVFTIFNN